MNNKNISSAPIQASSQTPLPHNITFHILKNISVVIFSIIVAILLAKAGVFETMLARTQNIKLISSFIIGMFFTSLFTAAPATAAFGELAHTNSIFLIAIFGGLGAMVGDFILFKFLKKNISDNFIILFSHPKSERLLKIMHLNFFHWLLIFVGALVIASPLPDELGLALMGISELKPRFLLPFSFLMNTIGIFILGLIAKQFV